MGSRRLCAAVLAGMLAIAAAAFGADRIDDTPEAVDGYNRAQLLLQKSDWQGAGNAFRDLISKYPQSKNLDLFLYNAGRADYHRSAYADASAAFKKLVGQFPESVMRPYAEYFWGNCRYALTDLDGAIDSWLDAWRDAREEKLQKLVVSSLAGAFNSASDVTIDRKIFVRLSADKRCLLSKHVLKSIPETKTDVRQQLIALCSDSAVAPTVPTIPAQTKQTPKAEYRIAIILPFSGGLESFAQQIMQGATVGAEEIAQKNNILLQLVPFDTKGDPIGAARLVQQVDSSTMLAAIGPLTSDEAAVASASLGGGKLPLLIPAATDAGLTTLSETSFQLSANVELQGIAMAEYAVNVLKADSAAVMTSTEPNFAPIVRAFTTRFEHLGGKVVATEYYRTRDRDFGPYLKDLKAMYLGYQADSVYYINTKGDTLDAEGVPVHIDCLFLPGDPSALRQILPQVRYFGIDGSLLGSDGWGDTLIYRMGDDLTRQAVFPSPFILHENTEQYVTFAGEYQQRIGAKPSRLACLGYDAVRLIGGAVASGVGTRSELVEYLSRQTEIAGSAGPIRFGTFRENTAMPMYRVQSGQAVPLEVAGASSPSR